MGAASPAFFAALVQSSREDAVVVVDDVQGEEGIPRGKGDVLLDVLERDGFTVEIVETEPGYLMAIGRRREEG